MKELSSKTCPIGFDCNDFAPIHRKKYSYCNIRDRCKDIGVAWEIPYYSYWDEKKHPVLIVKDRARRTPKWEKESYTPSGWLKECFLPSGYYADCPDNWHEKEIGHRILKAWEKEGFVAAVKLRTPNICKPI